MPSEVIIHFASPTVWESQLRNGYVKTHGLRVALLPVVQQCAEVEINTITSRGTEATGRIVFPAANAPDVVAGVLSASGVSPDVIGKVQALLASE